MLRYLSIFATLVGLARIPALGQAGSSFPLDVDSPEISLLALTRTAPAPEPGACTVAATSRDVPEGTERGVFFLVVPNDGSGEGSYGATSDGASRDAATSVCFAQGVVDSCAP